jgi:predicted nucleotidyltransferase
MKHHEDSIATFVERVSAVRSTLAVVVTGSVARGTEKPTSDVDLYLVVTEEAWAEAFTSRRLMFVETQGAEYEGGYFDVKLATLSYIDDAAERGDDPVRDSFAHSRIAFSRVDDLAERLARAARVPDDEWEARAASFVAQCRLYGGYFLEQGAKSGDVLLTSHAAVHLVVAASRALLALNHVLFQGPKYLAKSVAALERRPEEFPGLVDRLLANPGAPAGRAVLESIEGFADWHLPPEYS